MEIFQLSLLAAVILSNMASGGLALEPMQHGCTCETTDLACNSRASSPEVSPWLQGRSVHDT